MDKKFAIIGGPTADNLMMIFQLQHKESIVEPPFATLGIKTAANNESQSPEIDLAFYPTKIEYLDDTGQRLGVSGLISCISTIRGYRESMAAVYADGHYNPGEGIGLLNVDFDDYESSDFKKQLEAEIGKKVVHNSQTVSLKSHIRDFSVF